MKTALGLVAGLGAIGFAIYSIGNPPAAAADVSGTTDTGDTGIPLNKDQQIAQYAMNAGFSGPDLVTAIAVALAESGGNFGPPDGDQSLAPLNGPSKGLWQINIGAHPEYSGWDLYDPQQNAIAAYSVYRAARSTFRPWSTFDPRNGTTPKYLKFLDRASTAVNG